MKQLCLLFVLLFGNQVMACPSIIGTWKSDKELSMAQNRKNIAIAPSRIELLEQILGKLKETYTETEVHDHGLEPIKVTVNGKMFDFHFEDLTYKYEVLSCAENQLTIKKHYPYGGSFVETITFVNENMYWTNSNQENPSIEYFVRESN